MPIFLFAATVLAGTAALVAFAFVALVALAFAVALVAQVALAAAFASFYYAEYILAYAKDILY